MGTNRPCHPYRHHKPLYPSMAFGQWKFKSLGDSKYRETLAVIKDVSEKRRLEETSKRLSSALDQVMEVIAILDAKDGAILHSNALFPQLFGNPSHWAPKQKFMDLFECRVLDAALEQARAGQAWTGRSSLRTHAGKRITFEGTVAPVRNLDGEVESVVVRLRDITLEAEKDRHLRQVQKMNTLGALAGGMAHDFNNLIGAILSAAELIEMQIEPDSPIQKRLEVIQRVGGRARDLSKQILNFSRRSDDKWTPFDLTDLLSEVISFLQTTLPRNVEVRSDLTKGMRILGDPSQLHQAIMNLGINGSQAMQPKGGVLTIRLQPAETNQRGIGQPILEPCVLLTIEDTGCGMDPETLEKIFEPFFTTKEAGHGTGLGLSVVNDIVQGHGGNLQVSSQPGKGSAFKICLPIYQDLPQRLNVNPTALNISSNF
jgi:PAS domain S-box-containing protein